MNLYEKKGYLNNNFRIFHLKDAKDEELEGMKLTYHYHDFDKVILFLSGDVTYSVEGRKYELKPYDIVMIGAGEIHMPVIRSGTPYERIIIYISSAFMEKYKNEAYDLSQCLRTAGENHSHVLRMEQLAKSSLFAACKRLEESFQKDAYANELYQQILFLEFMILLNRALLENDVSYLENTGSNRKTAEIIDYINENLNNEISVDILAERFYMSRSYLMHLFKAETGYSVGSYINEKRLLAAKNMIQNGMAVTDACYACGFRDYSTFSRAFKKKYMTTPKNSGKLQ